METDTMETLMWTRKYLERRDPSDELLRSAHAARDHPALQQEPACVKYGGTQITTRWNEESESFNSLY
jgi:hypothetical protein